MADTQVLKIEVTQSALWSIKDAIGHWEYDDAGNELFLALSFAINSKTFGNQGIQLQYNSGTPRGYMGDGANQYFKFDGTNTSWKGANSELTAAGNLICTGGTIGGFTLSSTTLTASNLLLDAGNQKIQLGSGNDIIILDATNVTYRLVVGNAVYGSAPFSVTKSGFLISTSGQIGGWSISSTAIYIGSDMGLDAATKKFWINDAVYGNSGIQMRYVGGGGGKIYAGNGINQYFQFDGATISWEGTNTKLTAAGQFSCSNILATGGTIGGWTLASNKISITGIELDQANNRIRAYTGANYVDITAAGLTGYDSVLGTVFKIYTNGSAPEFSSGIIKECEYQVYTSGVIKTDSDPATNGGLLINNTSLTGYNSSGNIRFQVVYDGTDQGDVTMGDYSSNKGAMWDQSAGTFDVRGSLNAGDLTAGTLSVDRIAAGSIKASKLDGTDFGTFTLTSGKISLEAADALDIKSGSAVTIYSGADLILEADDSDPGWLKFAGSSYTTIMGAPSAGGLNFELFPDTDNVVDFWIGRSVAESTWCNDLHLECKGSALLTSFQSSNLKQQIWLYSSSGRSYIEMSIRDGGNSKEVMFAYDSGVFSPRLYPAENEEWDLGLATNKWNNIYSKNGYFYNELKLDDSPVARIYTGSYTGDGTTSKAITGVGFTPKFVWIVPGVADGVYSSVFMTTTELMALDPQGLCVGAWASQTMNWDNRIISLDSDGFTVSDDGSDFHPNTNGQLYVFTCLG